jgi:Na+/pantothenate symporter
MAVNLIRELFQQSDSSGSRSTVLKPLTWFISLIIGGIILLLKVNSPQFLISLLSIILTCTILIFLFAYVYCLFTDKDAIRSEKYSIQKMAIEKGLYGDSNTGLLPSDRQRANFSQIEISNSEDIQEL